MLLRHLRYLSLTVLFVFAAALFNASVVQAQDEIYTGRNINMVSGTQRQNEQGQRVALGGDPFLQRQNEPSIAVSSRNPMHLLAGANDYRTVDTPGPLGEDVIGDCWLGLFKSFDGGQTWQSTLMPGFPQANFNPNESEFNYEGRTSFTNFDPDESEFDYEGATSPIHGYEASADPTVRAGTNGMFYYSGIAFNRGDKARGVLFVSRFIDLNNQQGAKFDIPANKDPIKFIDTTVLRNGTPGRFMDKPWMAVDKPRANAATTHLDVYDDGDYVSQDFKCGNIYVAYAVFLGNDEDNPHTAVEVVRSTDCGATWEKPVKVSPRYHLNQGVTLAIDPNNGDVYVAWQVWKYDTQVPQIVIARSTDGGEHFGNVVQVAETFPFNQGERPNPEIEGDPFRLFRTNAYPTLAIDNQSRIYIAWAERTYWGNANLPDDEYIDGSRIVIMSSKSPGISWGNRHEVDFSDAGNVVAGDNDMYKYGHHIMPSFSYGGGKLSLLFYDFGNDYYHQLYNHFLANAIDENGNITEYITSEDGTVLGPSDPSMPPADPNAFEPFPVRHTVDVRVAVADVPDGANEFATFDTPSRLVSRYMTTIVAYSETGDPDDFYFIPVQLKSNQVNLPLFGGGTTPFLGDYIDIASQTFVPDGMGGWNYKGVNVSGTATETYGNAYTANAFDDTETNDASVFHAVWTDNRDVLPPPARIVYVQDVDEDGNLVFDDQGNPVMVYKLALPDWTNYSPPGGSCEEGSWPGMRNQNIYSSQITEGLVVGSYGNSMLLDSERAFSIFVENTTQEAITHSSELEDYTWSRSSRFFRMTIQVPSDDPDDPNDNIKASFKPLSVDPDYREEIVEVYNLSRVALTVFAKAEGGDPSASIKILVEEVYEDSQKVTNGLKSTLMLNPDPINPDQPDSGELEHDPEFQLFSCDEILAQNNDPYGFITNCQLGGDVDRLLIQWPELEDSDTNRTGLINYELLDPAYLQEYLLNPAHLNPAHLNPAHLNPAHLNPAHLNPAHLNPAHLNPAHLNESLLSPAHLNESLLNPAHLNATYLSPAHLNPAHLNPAHLNPAHLNPAHLNPAHLNPAHLNPAHLNPAHLNAAPEDAEEQLEAIAYIAQSTTFIDGTDLIVPDPITGYLATLTDMTWKVTNIGSDAATFFFTWFTNLNVAPEQILFYRTYKAPSVDLETCQLNENEFFYEFLANILEPMELDPEQLTRALTFSVAPEDTVYITMRFKDENGRYVPGGNAPESAQEAEQIGASVTPEAPPDMDNPTALATVTTISASPNPVVYGDAVTLTATVYSPNGTPPNSGTVTFYVDGIGTDINLSGTNQASLPLPGGTLNAGSYPISAEYGGYLDQFSGSSSGTITLYVNQRVPIITVTGGIFLYDGLPHPASAIATGVGGVDISGSGTFSFTYTPPGDATEPVNVGTYNVTAVFTSNDPNYANATGYGTITIEAAAPLYTITANMLYNDMPVTGDQFTFFVTKDGQMFPAAPYYDGAEDNYKLPNMPDGNYNIQASAKVVPPDRPFLPGHLYSSGEPSVTVDGADVIANLRCNKLIHLTSPVNNIQTLHWPGSDGVYDVYYTSSVDFQWEPIDAAIPDATYEIYIERYEDGGNRVDTPVHQIDITGTSYSAYLYPSADGEHYQMRVYAYNSNGTRIGQMMVYYDSGGFGWDYRFKVSGEEIIYSNFDANMGFDSDPSHSWTINGYLGPGIGQQAISNQFTPSKSYKFTGVRIPLQSYSGPPNFSVFLQEDAGGLPGTVMEQIDVNGVSGDTVIITATSILQPILNANTQYWITVTANGDDVRGGWQWNSIGEVLPHFAVNQDGTPNGSWNLDPNDDLRGALEIHGIPGEIIYSNFTANMGFDTDPYHAWTINGDLGIGGQQAISNQFTPSKSYKFTEVRIPLRSTSGPPNFSVFLQEDAGGLPGTVMEQIDVNGVSGDTVIITATSILQPILNATTQYWITVTANGDGVKGGWQWNSIGEVLPHFAVNQDGIPNGSWGLDPNSNPRSALEVHGVDISLLPDLWMSAAMLTPPAVAPGDTVTASYLLFNGGAEIPDTDAVVFDHGIYISADDQLDADDDNLLYLVDNWNGLPAGWSENMTRSITIPSGLTGTYYLFFVVDIDDMGWGDITPNSYPGVEEVDDTNNNYIRTTIVFP